MKGIVLNQTREMMASTVEATVEAVKEVGKGIAGAASGAIMEAFKETLTEGGENSMTRYRVRYFPYTTMINIFGFRMILECITDRQTDETRERGSDPNDIISLECKLDCRGQIIISVGVGVLAGALILAVGRWGLRYMVVDKL